ncbi:MAG: transporter associated domain-containing protein, partial [Xanthobacteraceae bacterium]
DFDVGDAAEDVDTLGGYLVTKVGRVPVRGELVLGPGLFEIEVLDSDPRRIKKVKIYRRKSRRAERSREAKRRQDLPNLPNAPSTSAEEPASAEGPAGPSEAASAKNTRRP